MEDSKVNLCYISFYNNMAQRYHYAVYDLRDPRQHKLKNSIDVSSQTISNINNLKELDLQHPLFAQRKRVFNYCLCFKENSSFTQALRSLCNFDIYDYVEQDIEQMTKLLLQYKAQIEEHEFQSFQSALKLAKLFHKEHSREFAIIIQPASSIFNNYPFLLDAQLMKLDFPNEIILNQLYLGNSDHAKNNHILKALRIKRVVNCAKEVPNYFEDQYAYHNIRVQDLETEQINRHFDDAYKFIQEAIDNKEKVLIHCAWGKSRSAAITLMYLMRKFELGFSMAYEIIQSKRNIVSINDGFLQQLQ